MLSFLTVAMPTIPTALPRNRELLRLYYRSKGYADAGVPSAVAEYDPATRGFVLTFSIDEGRSTISATSASTVISRDWIPDSFAACC